MTPKPTYQKSSSRSCKIKCIGPLTGTQPQKSLALEQVNRFTKNWQSQHDNKTKNPKRRTVAELLEKAEQVKQTRKRIELEKAAAELAEKQKLQKIAREKRLNEITGRESLLWDQIEILTSEKKAKSYDKAIELVTDLRDLAQGGN